MIYIYTKDYCPYCDMAKNLLKSLDQDYTEIDVTNDTLKLREVVTISGMMTVPQIFVGSVKKENLLGGYSDIKALHDEGKLISKIKDVL